MNCLDLQVYVPLNLQDDKENLFFKYGSAGLRLPLNLEDDKENLFLKYGSVTNHIYVKLLRPLSDNVPPDRQRMKMGKWGSIFVELLSCALTSDKMLFFFV